MGTLTELFESLLPTALIAGVNVIDYWDLTFKEITLIIEAYKEREKNQLASNYNNALMTANYVWAFYSGNKVPTL